MVKIRLKRFGARKNPHYRIVVTDARKAREGAYLESLGSFDPRGTQNFTLDEARLGYWLEQGAQMSPRVKALRKRVVSGQETPEEQGTLEIQGNSLKEVDTEETSVHPEHKEEKKRKKHESVDVEETEQAKSETTNN